jgi:hypothetical protein
VLRAAKTTPHVLPTPADTAIGANGRKRQLILIRRSVNSANLLVGLFPCGGKEDEKSDGNNKSPKNELEGHADGEMEGTLGFTLFWRGVKTIVEADCSDWQVVP